MATTRVEIFEESSITEDIIKDAAELFSNNYGVWGPRAAEKMGGRVKEGTRIKMSPANLKKQIFPSLVEAKNIYIRSISTHDNTLLGNLFATYYLQNGNPHQPIIWITQLCISKDHRNQGIAKQLLQALKEEGIHKNGDTKSFGVGILSSHPFAIEAVLRVFGGGIENFNGYGGLDWMRESVGEVREVMGSCPVGYVREAKLKGSLFQEVGVKNSGMDWEVGKDGKDGCVSCADTKFWVDHSEPDEALRCIREKKGIVWPFGELPDGCEFLVYLSGVGGR